MRISTLIGKVNIWLRQHIRGEWRLFVLGFFVIVGVIAGIFALESSEAETKGILGGPLASQTSVSDLQGTILTASPFINIPLAEDERNVVGFVVVGESAVMSANSPLGDILADREGLLVYTIQEEDTLSKLASHFGISVDTILWENQNLSANLVRPGEKVIVLPVSGITYQMKEGETLESVAARYKADYQDVKNFNKPDIKPGDIVIIPGASPARTAYQFSASLPDISGHFSLPVKGWNWGRLHEMNAVDIANACGTPIYAAAEGLVEEMSLNIWSQGYGRNIIIKHPNGTKTRYAHNSENLVSVGDYVARGDQIALIGNTGNVHGPTGCHLHFEVIGAKNPFAK